MTEHTDADNDVLLKEAEWLERAHVNSADKGYSAEYRKGFAAAAGWVRFHAKNAEAVTYPDAGLPIEHVADRHGYIWRVVRDGGMATRAHHTGLVSIGIMELERQAGPLVLVRLAEMTDQLRHVEADRDIWRQYAEERWAKLTQENSDRHRAETKVACLRKLADDLHEEAAAYTSPTTTATVAQMTLRSVARRIELVLGE